MAIIAGSIGLAAIAGATAYGAYKSSEAGKEVAGLQADAMRHQSDNMLMGWKIQSDNHLQETRILADGRRFEIEQATAAQKFQMMAWTMTQFKSLGTELRIALKNAEVNLREIEKDERLGLEEIKVRRLELETRKNEAKLGVSSVDLEAYGYA